MGKPLKRKIREFLILKKVLKKSKWSDYFIDCPCHNKSWGNGRGLAVKWIKLKCPKCRRKVMVREKPATYEKAYYCCGSSELDYRFTGL